MSGRTGGGIDSLSAVSDAAARLQVSEYAVFERAYEQWHGKTADDLELVQHFRRYLLSNTVPYWVRHFCRSAGHAVSPPGSVQASPLRCVAVGAYLVGCVALAGGLMCLY